MRRLLTLCLLACCLWLTAAGAAELTPAGDFENGLTGWEVKAEAGAVAFVAKEKPAAGKGSLVLQSTLKNPAWALSPALTDAAPGQAALITFSARRASGQAALLLDLVGSLAEVGTAGLWEAQLPADANWHKVSLLVKLPPSTGPLHLAFGALGGPGSWQVDEVTVQPATLPGFAPADQKGEAPQTQRLPAGWQPEGTLDATTKDIAGSNELLVNVNGIGIGVLPDFVCYRGFRDAMTIFAVNRGEMDKTLHVEVAGSDAIDSPGWDVPIKKTGTTTFHLSLQSLRAGQSWARLTFTSAGSSAALPVKITCKPSYPAFGAFWQDTVDPAALQTALQIPLDLQVLSAPADLAALQPMAKAVQAAGGEYLAAPAVGSLTAAQYAAAVGQCLDALQPSFWLPYCGDDPTTAFVAAPGIVEAMRKKTLPGGVLSAPLDLSRDPVSGQLTPAKASLLTADRLGGLLALTCRLPRLRPACVLQEQIDGKGDVPGGAALAQARQSDLGGVRGLLNERRLNLPLFADRLQVTAGSDERLDNLALVKALVNILYQGSTGVTCDAAQAVRYPQVLRLVQQELASATPLVALTSTADASVGVSTPITYRPFLRGGEGIVVVWNNTSAPKDVTLEFRSQPVVSRRLVFSYGGDLVTERWEPIMKFSEEAFKRGVPSVYLHLEPLQVQIHTFRLLDPHAAWLSKVALTTPFVPVVNKPVDHKEERTWWTDMLKGGRSGNLGQ